MESNDTPQTIESLWSEHCNAGFPDGLSGAEFEGICVTYLDAIAAGCIQTFLAHGGMLELAQATALDLCRRDLATVVSHMSGAAKEYFARLEVLATLVLEDNSARAEAMNIARRLDLPRIAKDNPPPQSWFDGDEPEPF
jgi:hypothetical protein